MQVQQLLRLLHNPQKITSEEVTSLYDLLKLYPYFQTVYMLLAKAAWDSDRASSGPTVQKAAVYATDRNHLKALLQDMPPFAAHIPETIPIIPTPNKQKTILRAEAHNFLDGYINTLQKKAQRKITNQNSLAQLDDIQAFLKKNVSFKPKSIQDIPNEDLQADLTHRSTTFHDELATESLARVLQQQGKWQRALAIYEKLMLKLPEKRTYFVPIIEELKRQI